MPKIWVPRFFYHLHIRFAILIKQIALALDERRKKEGAIAIKARRIEFFRNGVGSVLTGAVVVDITEQNDPRRAIKKAVKRIVRCAKKFARRKVGVWNLTRYLPLEYTRIAVFHKDRRARSLYGLDTDLICTIQLKRSFSKNIAPDIGGSKIEQVGSYRIAWNKSWLESLEGDGG